MEIFVIALVAYLLGCIPSALLVVKITSGKDILKSGSGNVGAMNSYEITNKKYIGLVVFIADALKGLAAVLLAKQFIVDTNYMLVAGFLAILGHNYNIFLRFKGGKGLATAVGVFSIINPFAFVIWLMLWIGTFKVIKKDIQIANIVASIFSPLVLFVLPIRVINMLMVSDGVTKENLELALLGMSLLILLKHTKDIKMWFAKSEVVREHE